MNEENPHYAGLRERAKLAQEWGLCGSAPILCQPIRHLDGASLFHWTCSGIGRRSSSVSSRSVAQNAKKGTHFTAHSLAFRSCVLNAFRNVSYWFIHAEISMKAGIIQRQTSRMQLERAEDSATASSPQSKVERNPCQRLEPRLSYKRSE